MLCNYYHIHFRYAGKYEFVVPNTRSYEHTVGRQVYACRYLNVVEYYEICDKIHVYNKLRNQFYLMNCFISFIHCYEHFVMHFNTVFNQFDLLVIPGHHSQLPLYFT